MAVDPIPQKIVEEEDKVQMQDDIQADSNAHSTLALNLFGVCAAERCVGAVSFFGLLQAIYNFFSVSTHHWVIMLQYVEKSKHSELVAKRVSDTRWCARADATVTLSKGFSSFQKALQVIAEDMTKKLQVIHEAK
ncbi:zinc finger MYM-type protein 1 [Trichonephila clavata]|uniref:Zinc finger MYM-type protein 1 n=1 Tax=Trichonephila clavata TaxID=2740835 RepID=A0A8X6FF15_TRICU|nr:zinc finger MYM-type protein 1 [Trichonephila clavata]